MEAPIQRIVAAIDFSNTTPEILRLLRRFHSTFSAKFILVHIITDQVLQHLGQNFPTKDKALEFAMEETLPLWKKVEEEMGGMDFETLMMPGIPYKAILEVAEEQKADLLVMGSHPPSRLQEIFVGNTARNLLKNTSIPVVFVTPLKQKQEKKE